MQRIFHNVEQNSDEWCGLRLGKPTSSNFGLIMANSINAKIFDPNRAFGEPAKTYARQLAYERVTGRKYETQYYNDIFNRGHEKEPLAIQAYEIETFYSVDNGGFYEFGKYGDSNDGNVGKNGCVEVKTAIEKVMFETIEKGGYDTSYKWQIQGHCFVGNKQWCDFIRFCPEFYEPKRLYIHRVERDELMIGRLKQRLIVFDVLVDEKVKILLKA